MERVKVGEVFHFYGHISVAAIRLTDGALAIGDRVQIQGPTTNVEQIVDSLQIEHATVSRADPGQEVGMKVRERVREKDFVYKVVQAEAAAAAAMAPAAPAKKVSAKKAAARKAPRKKPARKARVRKASRARRSTALRGSRKSRRRSR